MTTPFSDAQGHRKDGPTAPAILDIIAKYDGQPAERVALGLPYFDRDARVDPAAAQQQIDWYHSIGAIKDEMQASTVLDSRYVIERPAPAQ